MSAKTDRPGIIQRMKTDIATHRGAYTRLVIYLAIAWAVDIIRQLDALTPEIVANMYWWDWSVLWMSPVLAALIVWRTFLDGSMERSKTAAKDNATPPTDEPKV